MRRILLAVLKLAISAALLYVSLRKTDFSELASRLNLGSLTWLLLGIGLLLAQGLLGAVRWRFISLDCGAPLTTMPAFRFNMIGSFFNQTLPSSIGGDAVRLWLLARTGAGWRAATYSIFVDRAIGLIALAVLIVASLPWSYELIADPHGRNALLLVDLAALGSGFGFLVLGWLQWPWLKRWWATHHLHACSAIANRLMFGWPRGVVIAALSLSIHALTAVVAWCASRSIAAPVMFSQLFLLVPPVILITMLPVSIAGWGLREATLGLAFSYAGMAASEGVNVSLLLGAMYLVVGGIGGLVWVASAEKAAKGSAPIAVPEETAPSASQ